MASFWGHLSLLRQTLIKILLFSLCGFTIAFSLHETLFEVLSKPLQRSDTRNQTELVKQRLDRERIFNPTTQALVYQNGSQSHIIGPGSYVDVEVPLEKKQLIILNPIEGMLITFKICFWVGLIIASPFWGFSLLQFIKPALTTRERRVIIPFFALSFLFLCGGIALAYFATIPISNQYLHLFNASLGHNAWALSHYLDYTLLLLVGHALAFEFLLILLIAVHLKIITVEQMTRQRRYMIVAAFIVGALLTPPDVLSQVMLAIPLILLYEVAILYAHLRSNTNSKTN